MYFYEEIDRDVVSVKLMNVNPLIRDVLETTRAKNGQSEGVNC